MSGIDTCVIIAYLVAMILIGVYFSRKNKTTEEYFVGGRSYNGWTIGLSMVGVSISSITFISFPADSFKTSWIRFLGNLTLPLCVLLAAYVFLPFFRKKQGFSAYEYLENRYGPSVRLYVSFVFIVTQVVRLSLILYLVGLLFHEITGYNAKMCMLVSGICVSIYTIIGGIDAVIWTDVIQTVILALGGIICLIVIVHLMPGGLSQIFSVAWEHGKLSFSDFQNNHLVPIKWDFSLTRKTGTMMLMLGFLYFIQDYSSNQTTIQRYYTTKNSHEARKALWVSALFCLPIWTFYMFLGTALYVFFNQFPTVETTEMLNGIIKAEQVLPFFIIHNLPKGVIGIIIAAALAAAMSSLSASINSISTSFVVDIYKRFLVKSNNDKHYLHVAFLISTIASALMISGAIILVDIQTTTLQDSFAIVTSLLGGGLLSIFMIGFFTKIADARAIIIGLLFTMIFTLWTVLSERNMLPSGLNFPLELYYTSMIGNIVMLITTCIAASILPKKDRTLKDMTIWE